MDSVPSWAYIVGTPLWAWAILTFVRTVRDWPAVMERWNERRRDAASIEGSQVARMDARMLRCEERCAALEEAHEECLQNLHAERTARAEEHAGRLEAEALLMARQRTDQEVQTRLSAGREADRLDRKGETKGAD